MKYFFLGVIFIFFGVSAQANELGLTREWLRLLHYEKNGSRYQSQIDGLNFFLHANGQNDPVGEYTETLLKIRETATAKEESERVGCRYPARLSLLKKNHPEFDSEIKDLQCPKFQKWFETLRGTGISLVFSSYYLNNPSSAFGHSFIRINKAPSDQGKRFELLDYGVNYAANMDPNDNAVVYAYKGIFGLYPGVFSSVPYYYKVREYSNAESRDLWEYEINYTQEQVDLLIAHLWELGPTYFDYWYLTENCSYHMFTLLEAGDPNLELTSGLKKFVIPSDTVLHLYSQKGRVRKFQYRPSIRSELFYRAQQLNEAEVQQAIQIVRHQQLPDGDSWAQVSTEKQAQILDTAIDLMDYKFPKEVQIQDSKESQFKNIILGVRSRNPTVSPTLKIIPDEKDYPHLAHGSRRMGLGFRAGARSSYVLLQYKFSLHDQLDPLGGYPDYSEIHFGDFQFTIDDQKRKFEFESFSLFEVISHSPFTALTPDISWRVRIGMDRLRQESCYLCHAPLFSVGPSMTFTFQDSLPLTVNVGARMMAYTTPSAPGNKLFIALGPEARIRYRVHDRLVGLIDYYSRADFNRDGDTKQTIETKLAVQYSFDRTQGIRFSGMDRQFESFGGADWFWYY